jgi:hypothetical protein
VKTVEVAYHQPIRLVTALREADFKDAQSKEAGQASTACSRVDSVALTSM